MQTPGLQVILIDIKESGIESGEAMDTGL